MPEEPARAGVAWRELTAPEAAARRSTGPLGRLVPPVAISAILGLLGARALALVVLVVGGGLGLASAWSPTFARVFDRALHAIGHAVGRVLTLVLLGLFEVFVIAPVSFLAWVFRRDPLASLPRPAPGGGWRHRSDDEVELADRAFGYEARPERGRLGAAVVLIPRVVGWIAIVVVLDLLIGSVTLDRAVAVPDDARLRAATADAPWWDDYVGELRSVEYEPTAFVLSQPVDHAGRYINVVGGHRVTVEPDGVPAEAPTVWVFGGSPAWGEGQRDAHTIASELAGLAAAGGTPVHVVNWAQRGDSAFVEAQRLERALAHETPPDLVLFLDGPDDLNIQAEQVTGNPSHHGLAEAEAAVEGDNRAWWQRYEDASALFAVGQWIHGMIAVQPAWAQAPTDQAQADRVADAVAAVYDRSRRLADDVSDLHDVDVRYYWLPIASSDDPDSIYLAAADRLETDVTLLPALDEDEGSVFLDAVHTNEAGARQVAESLHADLAPTLATLGGR